MVAKLSSMDMDVVRHILLHYQDFLETHDLDHLLISLEVAKMSHDFINDSHLNKLITELAECGESAKGVTFKTALERSLVILEELSQQ